MTSRTAKNIPPPDETADSASITTRSQFFVAMALSMIMFPSLCYALSFGNLEIFRASQLFWVFLLGVAVFVAPDSFQQRPSFVAILFVAILIISMVEATMYSAFTDPEFLPGPILKTVIICLIVLLLDRFRGISFERFALFSLPLIFLILATTVVHFIVNPIIVYGRYTFFGLQPNLGGEVLFSCVVLVVFAQKNWIRISGSFVSIILMVMLQTRGALLGTGVILILSEGARAYLAFKAGRLTTVVLAGFIVFFGLVTTAIMFPGGLLYFFNFLDDRIFLLSHAYRGLNTGLVGRGDTWNYALEIFFRHPIMGSGLDRSGITEEGLSIHSGYFKLLAEFGIFSIGLFLILSIGLVESARQKSGRFFVVISCLTVFFFNARSINLNVFPLILWVACLPWAPSVRR